MSDTPPPKPPVPKTNLLPVILAVGVLALVCLSIAIMLPSPRRPVPPAVPPGQTHPNIKLPPITEYETAIPATLPSPTTLSPTTVTPTEPSPSAADIFRLRKPIPPGAINVPEIVRWQTNAHPAPEIPAGTARLAIVIDDMGLDEPATRAAMAQLPPPISFAFLPYAPNSAAFAEESFNRGHDILVHIPMEPLPRPDSPNPGPHALHVEDDTVTRANNLAANLNPLLTVAAGANNHMGSRFTQWPEGMQDVLTALHQRGLFFLDSVTTAHTATTDAAKAAALQNHLPILRRDIFLDDNPTTQAVRIEFTRAVAQAKKRGSAIAIGHPHPATLAVLAEMLPTLANQNIILVPITSLISANNQ